MLPAAKCINCQHVGEFVPAVTVRVPWFGGGGDVANWFVEKFFI